MAFVKYMQAKRVTTRRGAKSLERLAALINYNSESGCTIRERLAAALDAERVQSINELRYLR